MGQAQSSLYSSMESQGLEQIEKDSIGFWKSSPTFNKKRFNKALIFSTVAYTSFSTGLYLTWYKQYPTEGFHLFNDMAEWKQVDKVGHIYTAYLQGVLCYKGAKWVGLSEGQSIATGIICGSLFQTTIEVMDGFSSEWGFSVGDFAANVIGIGAFAFQQKYWGEQRILIKESSWAPQLFYRPDKLSIRRGIFIS